MAKELTAADTNRMLATLSTRLRNSLDGDQTTTSRVSDRILALAADPALLAEAKGAVADLKALAAPADGQTLVNIMTPYQEPYNRVPREKQQWKMFWLVYVEALEGVSAGALKEALKAYVRLPTSRFFPEPGPLLALCEAQQDLQNRRWRMIEAALALPAGADDPDAAKTAYTATYSEPSS